MRNSVKLWVAFLSICFVLVSVTPAWANGNNGNGNGGSQIVDKTYVDNQNAHQDNIIAQKADKCELETLRYTDKKEKNDRIAADNGLQDNINTEANTRGLEDTRLNSRIDNLSSRVDKVGALAAAFSALAPMPYDAAQPTQLSIGAGTYSGQQALAIGIYHYTKNDVLLNAGLAISGGEKMGRVGVTWKIGGKKKVATIDDCNIPIPVQCIL